MPKRLALGAVVLALGLAAATAQEPQAPGTPADPAAAGPRPAPTTPGELERLARDDADFAGFARRIRPELEALVAQPERADRERQRQWVGTLLQLDVLEGRDAEAIARIEALRALQDEPAARWLTGLHARALVEARRAVGDERAPGFAAALRQRLDEALRALPHDVVAGELRQARADAQRLDEAQVLGRLRAALPPARRPDAVPEVALAPAVVNARYVLLTRLPLKATLAAAYGAYLAAHRVDRWAGRQVDLPAGQGLAPVTIAVWDSGVDLSLFDAQVRRGADGRPLFVAFDRYSNPTRVALAALPPLQSRLPQLLERTQGFSDLQYRLDSPQAEALQGLLATLAPPAREAALEEIARTGVHVHGTHVAGIALAGNPYARLLSARIEVNPARPPDPCPSRAQVLRDAQAIGRIVEFLRRHGARVVNMSWSGSVRAIEDELAQCGTGGDAPQRAALAREYYRIGRAAMARAFAGAPDILWIAAAANRDGDAAPTESAPADLVLPNLLTVGAVGRDGAAAAFTGDAPTVKVYANGEQVDSVVPGGQRLRLSGTSMAAPQVANLAGKMLALDPRLTPPQVIALIVATAEPGPDEARALVHPAQALQAVRSRRTRPAPAP